VSPRAGLGSRPLKVAVAGAGFISPFHLAGWKAVPNIEIAAVCDPVSEKAQARAKEFAVAAAYADFTEMLERERPDAVDVATPVATHAPLVRMAADRGVHVMVQKPMTPTVAEAESLVRDVGDRVRFMVHENFRFRPHYATVRQWLRAGRVGTPRQARLTVRSSGFLSVEGAAPALLARQPYLQGFPRLLVFEGLIHHLDVLRCLFGKLTVESAALGRVNPTLAGEDVAIIVLRGANGFTAVLDGSYAAHGYPVTPVDRLEIMGERATLLYDITRLSVVGSDDAAVAFDPLNTYQAPFTEAIRHFTSCLRNGEPFETEAADNLHVLRLVEACYAAAGKPV
jgi:predicted dehydrogenase